jgi:hypothetical protein
VSLPFIIHNTKCILHIYQPCEGFHFIKVNNLSNFNEICRVSYARGLTSNRISYLLLQNNNNKTTFGLYNQHSHEIGLRLTINNFLKIYFHTIYIEAQINVVLLFCQIRDQSVWRGLSFFFLSSP